MSATWRGPSSAARSRWGSAACAQYSRPSTLSSTICCHSGSGAPAAGPSSITPGVVDQRVEPAQLGDRALHRAGRLLLVGDVALQHQRGAALVADAGGERLQPVLAAAPPAPPPRPGRRARRPWPRRCRSTPRSPARRCHPVPAPPAFTTFCRQSPPGRSIPRTPASRRRPVRPMKPPEHPPGAADPATRRPPPGRACTVQYSAGQAQVATAGRDQRTEQPADKKGPMAELRTLMSGLVFGEQPRWHEGRLWFSDWGTQEVIAVDLDGNSEVILRGTVVPVVRRLAAGRPPAGRVGARRAAAAPRARRVAGDPWRPEGGVRPPGRNELVVDGRGNAYVNGGGFDLMAGEAFAPGVIALVTPDGSARQVADGLAFPNGMLVMPDGSTLIVAESYAKRLTAFDIDADGGLSNRRVWADLGDGVPDGICADAENAVWYADVPEQALRARPRRRRGAPDDRARPRRASPARSAAPTARPCSCSRRNGTAPRTCSPSRARAWCSPPKRPRRARAGRRR